MKLRSISLYNFRSYDERMFTFDDDITFLTGPNGVGKTNVLEAVYVLLAGKSFRDGDEDLIRHGEDWWRVSGLFDETEREVRYVADNVPAKQLSIGGVKKGRFTYKQQLPVVLFEPDHLQMVHGSPSIRRKYLDDLLERRDAKLRPVFRRYERALQQRNNLLKQKLPFAALKDAVFVWDIALAEYGSVLREEREKLVKLINKKIADVYSGIAQKTHTVSVVYESNIGAGKQALAEQLAKNLEQDTWRGTTRVGPHRDDIQFLLDGKDSRRTASRGEVRTLVLALKKIEALLIQEATQDKPIVLLDDVLSELDASRQQGNLDVFTGHQVLVTTTSLPINRSLEGLEINLVK